MELPLPLCLSLAVDEDGKRAHVLLAQFGTATQADEKVLGIIGERFVERPALALDSDRTLPPDQTLKVREANVKLSASGSVRPNLSSNKRNLFARHLFCC